MQKRSIDVPGGRVALYESGCAGVEPALLLLSGGPAWSCEALLAGHERLAAAGRRVISWDPLGCGGSDNPQKPELWTLERYVREVDAVRRALELERVHLLGQDWGAMVAVEAALLWPECLASLILLTAIGDVDFHLVEAERLRNRLPAGQVAAMKMHEAAGTTDDPAYEEAMMEIFRRHVCRLDPWPEPFRRSAESVNKPIYDRLQGPDEFNFSGEIAGWSCLDRIGSLTMPSLVMVGRHDWCTVGESERLHAALPDSTLTIFEESAHIPYFEEPDAYDAALSAFLSAHD